MKKIEAYVRHESFEPIRTLQWRSCEPCPDDGSTAEKGA